MKNDKETRNRLHLSPLEKEILWTLREAGEENLTALLNTVEPLVSSLSDSDFFSSCERAFIQLLRSKYIELRIEQESCAGCRQLFLGREFDIHQAMQRGSDGLWQQSESWNGEGRIVVVQLVDHWSG